MTEKLPDLRRETRGEHCERYAVSPQDWGKWDPLALMRHKKSPFFQ